MLNIQWVIMEALLWERKHEYSILGWAANVWNKSKMFMLSTATRTAVTTYIIVCQPLIFSVIFSMPTRHAISNHTISRNTPPFTPPLSCYYGARYLIRRSNKNLQYVTKNESRIKSCVVCYWLISIAVLANQNSVCSISAGNGLQQYSWWVWRL